VHVLDQNLSLTSSHRLGEGISEIRLFPDSSALIAAAQPAREIIVADALSLRVTHRMKLPAEPLSFDLSKNGYVAVSTGAQGTVELLHPASGSHDLLILAARPDEHSILGIDVASRKFVAELPLAMEPDHLCFNSDQGQLFVTGKGMDGVAIIFPYQTLEVQQTLLATRSPGIMATSPAYLFIASTNGSDVSIVNIDARKLIGVVDVGGQPEFIAITPDNRFALVLNKREGTMAAVYIPNISWTVDKKGLSLFNLVDVGVTPVHMAVVPSAT
jgi:DNA-binding beta-propeller fold protein YncE